MCDRIATITNGEFQIIPSPANELVPALEVMNGVMAGTVECGHTASHYFTESPALSFMSGVPFGFNAQQQNAWLFRGEGMQILESVYSSLGLVHFPCGNTGPQMGGWFTQPISSMADLQGLKMRIVGMGGRVMERLGVTKTRLAANEIAAALTTGAIDAAEWVGPYDDMKLGLPESASYYYYPGWWTPGETLDAVINRDQWAQLPTRFQAAFQLAAAEANMTMMNRYVVANAKALQELATQGIELRSFTPEVIQAAQAAALSLYDEIAATDVSFSEVYTQWRSFRDRIFRWHQVNELGFANATFAQS